MPTDLSEIGTKKILKRKIERRVNTNRVRESGVFYIYVYIYIPCLKIIVNFIRELSDPIRERDTW